MPDFPPADDLERPRREPIFAVPAVIVALIAALIGAYAIYDLLNPATQDAALRDFAFLPGRLTLAIWPDRPFRSIGGASPTTPMRSPKRAWRAITTSSSPARGRGRF